MLKRGLGLAATGAALLFALSAFGEVAIPPLKARVTDLTATLSESQVQSLESRLRDFERAKGSQIAVLMLPSTEPETIEQYSIRVAEAWKVGRAKIDDGVILVVAKNDRKLRIEVGRGLEGAITDGLAKRIVSEVITPHFKSGDFFGGIAAGTDALMRLIEGEPLPVPRSGDLPRPGAGWVLVLALIGVIGVGLYALSRSRPTFTTRASRRGYRHRDDDNWFSGMWTGGGGSGGGGWGGFGGGGDSGGFSGGGGDFGGGGASGSW